jgi:hypothetical protein
MVESTAGRPMVTVVSGFAYAAGATSILANVLLFAFFAVRASRPEVGASLGQRSGGIARDCVPGPCGAPHVRMVAGPTLVLDLPGTRPVGAGGPHGGRSAAGARGPGVRSTGTNRGDGLDGSLSLVVSGQSVVALLGPPRSAGGTNRRGAWCRHPGRRRGRRARILIALDVVAAALGLRRRGSSRHARHPGLVLATGPRPGIMTVPTKKEQGQK